MLRAHRLGRVTQSYGQQQGRHGIKTGQGPVVISKTCTYIILVGA
jgi:hypothetical protein